MAALAFALLLCLPYWLVWLAPLVARAGRPGARPASRNTTRPITWPTAAPSSNAATASPGPIPTIPIRPRRRSTSTCSTGSSACWWSASGSTRAWSTAWIGLARRPAFRPPDPGPDRPPGDAAPSAVPWLGALAIWGGGIAGAGLAGRHRLGLIAAGWSPIALRAGPAAGGSCPGAATWSTPPRRSTTAWCWASSSPSSTAAGGASTLLLALLAATASLHRRPAPAGGRRLDRPLPAGAGGDRAAAAALPGDGRAGARSPAPSAPTTCVFLPSFPAHQRAGRRPGRSTGRKSWWKPCWPTCRWPSPCCSPGAAGSCRRGPSGSSSGCSPRLAFLLTHHGRFTHPHQPLHFSHGYLWLPLFLLALPWLERGAARAQAGGPGRRWPPARRCCCWPPPTTSRSSLETVLTRPHVQARWIDPELREVYRRARPEDRGQPACWSPATRSRAYLTATYTPARPFYGHTFNTPQRPGAAGRAGAPSSASGQEGPHVAAADLLLIEGRLGAGARGWTPLYTGRRWKLYRRQR